MFDRPATPGEIAAATLRRLEQHPETHNQDYWFTIPDPADRALPRRDRVFLDLMGETFLKEVDDQELGTKVESWSACGITGCAAGHTIAAAIELGYPIEDARTECGAMGTGPLAEWLLGLVELDDGEYRELGTSQLSIVTDDDGDTRHIFDGGLGGPTLEDIKRGLQRIVDNEQVVA